MHNVIIHITQIQNAPNFQNYSDSRLLRVNVTNPDQNKYSQLSGTQTLHTQEEFQFQCDRSNSMLSFILMETKPNNFDIAYLTIPLSEIQTKLFIQESHRMTTVVSGIPNPIIEFDIQIIQANSLSSDSSSSFIINNSAQESFNSIQKPFIPNTPKISAIIKIPQSSENTFFIEDNIELTNEEHQNTSDFEEEEDVIINARIFFNDEQIKLLKQSKTIQFDKIPKNQNQQIIENQSDSEKSSAPFVPPEESDAPFLLPKQSLSENKKLAHPTSNSLKNIQKQSQFQTVTPQKVAHQKKIDNQQIIENQSDSEKKSVPFVPPEESDAPFLLPKQSLNENKKLAHQPSNSIKNIQKQSQFQTVTPQQVVYQKQNSNQHILPPSPDQQNITYYSKSKRPKQFNNKNVYLSDPNSDNNQNSANYAPNYVYYPQ